MGPSVYVFLYPVFAELGIQRVKGKMLPRTEEMYFLLQYFKTWGYRGLGKNITTEEMIVPMHMIYIFNEKVKALIFNLLYFP